MTKDCEGKMGKNLKEKMLSEVMRKPGKSAGKKDAGGAKKPAPKRK